MVVEPDYDAVNEMITESIMEEIGGIVMNMTDSTFINRDEMTVNDVLDYLGENYNTASEDSPYGSFLGIVTRELDRRFDERSR